MDDLNGGLADVTHLRFSVRDDVFTTELRQRFHELRRQPFDYPDFPAATIVGVSKLARDDTAIEVEAEAFISEAEWEKTVITPEE